MICKKTIKKFCKEDISKIENYDKAIADTTQTWVCHHRDEVKLLPSGMTVIRSSQDLKDAGRYYGCPANELVFMTPSEHKSLHGANMRAETKRKMSESMKGRTPSNKGKPMSAEQKQKLSATNKGKTNPTKGKTWKLVNGKRVWFSKDA